MSDWEISLCDLGWRLTDGKTSVMLGEDGAALSRIVIGGRSFLLVGHNGRSSLQAAIDAAEGGETILVAPGTYAEGRNFTSRELGGRDAQEASYGLVINKPVALQGVSEWGDWIGDCDDVIAAAVALFHSRDAVSFLVTADDVSISGLGFVPAGAARGPDGTSFVVRGSRFQLRGCVIERNLARGSAGAVHLPRRADGKAHAATLSCNVLHGSVTIDARGGPRPMDVTIIGNDVHGDGLPPVLVECDPGVLAAPRVQALLPVVEDNSLRPARDGGPLLTIRIDGPVDAAALPSPPLEAYLRKVLESHDGAGSLVIDPARIDPLQSCAAGADGALAAAGIQASIHAAQEQVSGGDALHAAADMDIEPHGTAWDLPAAGSHAAAPMPKDVDPADQELTGDGVMKLLNDAGGAAIPVRHFGGDARQKGAYFQLQAAIDAAAAGDRIEISPGTFTGNLIITRPVTLLGANAGRPGHSANRGLESVVEGEVIIRVRAGEVTIDGLTVRGKVTSLVPAGAGPGVALRCCIIDAGERDTAVTVLGGSGAMVSGNRIISGREEGIYAPSGFDGLVVSGNRIETAAGAAGIVLRAGAGLDSACILGNTVVGGDHGILLESGAAPEWPADSITIAGNCFGEIRDGIAADAPAIAAICADHPLSPALERSLGACIGSNVYNLCATAVPVDMTFAPGAGAKGEAQGADVARAGKSRA